MFECDFIWVLCGASLFDFGGVLVCSCCCDVNWFGIVFRLGCLQLYGVCCVGVVGGVVLDYGVVTPW